MPADLANAANMICPHVIENALLNRNNRTSRREQPRFRLLQLCRQNDHKVTELRNINQTIKYTSAK